MSMYAREVFESLSESISPSLCSYQGLKSTTVYDMARQVTFQISLHIVRAIQKKASFQEAYNQGEDTGHRVSNVNNINSNSLLSIKQSRKNSSSFRSCSPPTIMITGQLQPQRAAQSFSLPSSATSIDDAPFCRFCLANNLVTTQYPSILLQLSATLINTR